MRSLYRNVSLVRVLLTAIVLATLPGVRPSFAADATPTPLPPPPAVPYQWKEVVRGVNAPTFLVASPDDTKRLFVGEQDGVIFVIQNEKLVETPFLDIGELLTSDVFRGGYSERGLLGMAFAPDFKFNRTFYLYYINRANETALVRYKTREDNPNLADPATATLILSVKHPFENHKGGQIAFGPDGYLYIGIGDGGSLGDPNGNGQKLDTLLAKILRIDVNKAAPGKSYAIPPDNPFVGKAGALPEIWAYGLRNPWRFSFDKATGDLYIGEVGEARFEEVDFVAAGSKGGQNFGWSRFEGASPFLAGVSMDSFKETTAPIFVYPHTIGCAVMGGFVYRGTALPALVGAYFFGDYCTGRIWTLKRGADGQFSSTYWMETGRQISAFGQDMAGELYLVDYKGFVLRLTAK